MKMQGIMCKPDGFGGTYAELHFNTQIDENELKNMLFGVNLNTPELSEFVSVKKAAEILNVSKQTVYQMLRKTKCRQFVPAHTTKGLRVNIKDLERKLLEDVHE